MLKIDYAQILNIRHQLESHWKSAGCNRLIISVAIGINGCQFEYINKSNTRELTDRKYSPLAQNSETRMIHFWKYKTNNQYNAINYNILGHINFAYDFWWLSLYSSFFTFSRNLLIGDNRFEIDRNSGPRLNCGGVEIDGRVDQWMRTTYAYNHDTEEKITIMNTSI